MKCSAIAPNFIFSSNPNLLIMSKLEFITEGMLFKIRQHQQELPEALRRAALADYREGVFSITINTRDRRPLLGFIRNGEFYPSKVGQAVAECWRKIPEYYPQAELIIHQVMPEHFHGLLRLNPKNPNARIVGKSPAHLGRIVGGFMIGSTHAYWASTGRHTHGAKPSARNLSTSALSTRKAPKVLPYSSEATTMWCPSATSKSTPKSDTSPLTWNADR